ncbi:MAG: hypothetical protein ABA06_02505 [Parcubacteria bacterium C7867-001]|nr:MAG: hypothetical protein ABA06_02505 [Parcubacteria bacterium C7867-001]
MAAAAKTSHPESLGDRLARGEISQLPARRNELRLVVPAKPTAQPDTATLEKWKRAVRTLYYPKGQSVRSQRSLALNDIVTMIEERTLTPAYLRMAVRVLDDGCREGDFGPKISARVQMLVAKGLAG